MRLWTLHPQYLDVKGLLAVWREGLLARQVLRDQTRGYRNHPQLLRFKSSPDPSGSLAQYLRVIHREASKRGYRFNASKIGPANFKGQIHCTRGQLLYEWNHLKRKVSRRDPRWYSIIEGIEEPLPHPLFIIVAGDVEAWEIKEGRA